MSRHHRWRLFVSLSVTLHVHTREHSVNQHNLVVWRSKRPLILSNPIPGELLLTCTKNIVVSVLHISKRNYTQHHSNHDVFAVDFERDQISYFLWELIAITDSGTLKIAERAHWRVQEQSLILCKTQIMLQGRTKLSPQGHPRIEKTVMSKKKAIVARNLKGCTKFTTQKQLK